MERIFICGLEYYLFFKKIEVKLIKLEHGKVNKQFSGI